MICSKLYVSQSAPSRCGRVRTYCVATQLLVKDRATFKSKAATQFAPIINGCWQFAGGHGQDVFDNIDAKLAAHADAGFDTFDTADIYGPSEEILGRFVGARAAEGKSPPRIFTKYVPNIFQQRPTPSSVQSAIQRSLQKLQMKKLDLVQLHWWDYGIGGMLDVAKALADLQAKGLIAEVGLTNMNTAAVAQIIDAGVPIVSNQVQFSLLDRRPLNAMLPYCEEHGIKVLTYGSVAGGLLSDKYVEQARPGLFGKQKFSNVDLNTSSLKMYWGTTKLFGGQELWRELLLVLRRIADKHNVSVANVALRWVMQQGSGTSVHPIVGLRSAAHVSDNARVLLLRLDEKDLSSIDSVLARSVGPKGDCYSHERGEV